MGFQRRERLLVTPNNQGNFPEVAAFKNFEGQVGLSHTGIKGILSGHNSLREKCVGRK